MAYLAAWVEYGWARLRRFDYWGSAILTNPPASTFRAVGPGSQPHATVQKKEHDRVFDIRYFPRNTKGRDTEYYPDTPLSLNHNLMKNRPTRYATLPVEHPRARTYHFAHPRARTCHFAHPLPPRRAVPVTSSRRNYPWSTSPTWTMAPSREPAFC